MLYWTIGIIGGIIVGIIVLAFRADPEQIDIPELGEQLPLNGKTDDLDSLDQGQTTFIVPEGIDKEEFQALKAKLESLQAALETQFQIDEAALEQKLVERFTEGINKQMSEWLSKTYSQEYILKAVNQLLTEHEEMLNLERARMQQELPNYIEQLKSELLKLDEKRYRGLEVQAEKLNEEVRGQLGLFFSSPQDYFQNLQKPHQLFGFEQAVFLNGKQMEFYGKFRSQEIVRHQQLEMMEGNRHHAVYWIVIPFAKGAKEAALFINPQKMPEILEDEGLQKDYVDRLKIIQIKHINQLKVSGHIGRQQHFIFPGKLRLSSQNNWLFVDPVKVYEMPSVFFT